MKWCGGDRGGHCRDKCSSEAPSNCTFSRSSSLLKIAAPLNRLGGYYLSVISNTAFPNPKVLQISWGGLKYAMT